MGPHSASVVLLIQYYNSSSAYAIYTFHTDYYYISAVCVCVYNFFFNLIFLLLLLLPKVVTVFTGCNLRQRFSSNFSFSGEIEAKQKTIPEGMKNKNFALKCVSLI